MSRTPSDGGSRTTASVGKPQWQDEDAVFLTVRDARLQRLEQRAERTALHRGGQPPIRVSSQPASSSPSSQTLGKERPGSGSGCRPKEPALSTSLGSALKRPSRNATQLRPPSPSAADAGVPHASGNRKPASNPHKSATLAPSSPLPSANVARVRGFEGSSSTPASPAAMLAAASAAASATAINSTSQQQHYYRQSSGGLHTASTHAAHMRSAQHVQQPMLLPSISNPASSMASEHAAHGSPAAPASAAPAPNSATRSRAAATTSTSAASSAPAPPLPSHITRILDEAVAEGPALEAYDATAAMVIHNAQESGSCELCMRGLTQLPDQLLRFFKAEGVNVTQLCLQGNRLFDMPPLEQLPSLKHLDMSANLLTQLPASLAGLTRLAVLLLSENKLAGQLPEAVCHLQSLTCLHLSHNQLTGLPEHMGALFQLQELRLDHNKLSHVPDPVCRLGRLVSLQLQHNAITALPAELGGLTALASLSLHHNRLSALPVTVGKLQSLRDLLLHNNDLSVLPRELAQLSRLTQITTGCNPLIYPPQAVCKRGVVPIRHFLSINSSVVLQDEGEGGEGASSAGAAGQPSEGQPAAPGPEPPLLCSRCLEQEGQLEKLGHQLLWAQLEKERLEREAKGVADMVARKDAQIVALDKEVRGLMSERLASEKQLHGRASLLAGNAEELARQVRQLQESLRESQAREADLAARLADSEAQLGKERALAAAATAAAGGSERNAKLAQELQQRLDAAVAENKRLSALHARVLGDAKCAEDRQLEAEAALDVAGSRAQVLADELEGVKAMLAASRASADIAAKEADTRERQLHIEIVRLQSDLAALLAERDALKAAAGVAVPAPSSAAPPAALEDGGGHVVHVVVPATQPARSPSDLAKWRLAQPV